MSPKQKEVYDFMKSFHKEHKYPVSLRQLSEHFKVSYQTIQHHIKCLIKKGFVSKPKDGVYLTK